MTICVNGSNFSSGNGNPQPKSQDVDLMPPRPKKNLIIIGAGLSGLAAALHLQTHASRFYTVTVYERQARTTHQKNGGFAILLSANALRLLGRLGVPCPSSAPLLRGHVYTDSTILSKLSFMTPRKAIRNVERGPLLETMLKMFEEAGGKAVFSSTLSSLQRLPEGEMLAAFADGSTRRADFVIGADGTHSTVRRVLYTSLHQHGQPEPKPKRHWFQRGTKQFENWEPAPTPWTALYGITKPGVDMDRASTMRWHFRKGQGGAYTTYSLTNGRLFWVCYARELPNLSRTSGGGYTTAAAATVQRDNDHLPYDNGRFATVTDATESTKLGQIWHTVFAKIQDDNGQVLLVGDAAHPMTPFNGQGGGLGIEEGAVVTNALLRQAWAERGPYEMPDEYTKQATPKELFGFKWFDTQRAKRSQKVADHGYWIGIAAMGDCWPIRMLRNAAVGFAGAIARFGEYREIKRHKKEDNDDDRMDTLAELMEDDTELLEQQQQEMEAESDLDESGWKPAHGLKRDCGRSLYSGGGGATTITEGGGRGYKGNDWLTDYDVRICMEDEFWGEVADWLDTPVRKRKVKIHGLPQKKP